VREGDPGDRFYVLFAGDALGLLEAPWTARCAASRDYFGEVASRMTCADATVTAITPASSRAATARPSTSFYGRSFARLNR